MKRFNFKTGIFLVITLFFFTNIQAQIADSLLLNDGSVKSNRKNNLKIDVGFGGALVRNTLAPTFHIDLGMRHKDRYEGNLTTSSSFFFKEGDNGKYLVYRNTFLNAEFMLNMNPMLKSTENWNGLGIGYLIEARGRYFSETAMQLYYKKRYRYFSVMPALIFDDNFKDVWPMITIRL